MFLEHQFTFIVKKKFLALPSITETRDHNYVDVIDNIKDNTHVKCNNKVKMSTTDAGEGHLMIMWSPQDFAAFLDQANSTIVSRSRSTYALLFLISATTNCTTIRTQVDHILTRLWTNFSILNVIAQFPCSCGTQIFIYRPFAKTKKSFGLLQTYTIQQVTNNPNLILNPLNNLNKFPLKIALFEQVPSSVSNIPRLLKLNKSYKDLSLSGGSVGSDALLVATFAKYHNFEPKIVKNLPGSFGHVQPDGSAGGVLAEVLKKASDYGANRRLLGYEPHGYEFTVPYSSDKICAVAPKSEKVPRGLALITCFDKLSWIMFFVMSILCAIFWFFVRRDNVFKVLQEVYSFLLGVPSKVVPSTHQMVFLTSCMILNVIVLGVIQGSLFTDFTTSRYYKEINTLEEVDRTGLPIMTFAWLIVNDSNSEILTRLKRKSMPDSYDMWDIVAYHRNVVAIDRQFEVEVALRTNFTGRSGVPLLHIVDESIATYLQACIIPQGSPFLPIFNEIIVRMFEGGFILKWDNDVVDSLMIERINETSVEEEFKPFRLEDVQVAFYVVSVGYVCSMAAFLGEILKSKFGEVVCWNNLITR
ncbi:hypothetical protein Zmor_019367 [Zophobas morio]|uniref:Ionotropic glutamate receptor C-terminal domain-containing protein n=1 Tax=Zophobas morio TaxID=2755281 RepID=A0AA38I1J5_9CUCU|nr:hypothetical protein Zmor_019367 [Zophobas morio]